MLIEFLESKNLIVNKTCLYLKIRFLGLGVIDILGGDCFVLGVVLSIRRCLAVS